MHVSSVVHLCLKPSCTKEAKAERVGLKVSVECRHCGAKARYPAETLNRSDLRLLNVQIGSRFMAYRRCRPLGVRRLSERRGVERDH